MNNLRVIGVASLLATFFCTVGCGPAPAQEEQTANPFKQAPVESQPSAGVQSTEPALVDQNGPSSEGALDDQAAQPQQEQRIKLILETLNGLIPGDEATAAANEPKLREVIKAYAAQDSDKLRELLAALKAASPTFPPADLVVAGLHFGAGQDNAGFLSLEAAARSKPNYPGVYFALSRLALNQRRATDAEALVEKGIRAFQAGEFTEFEAKRFQSEYFQLMITVALRKGQLEKATRLAADFEKMDGDEVASLRLTAEVAFRNDDIGKSLDYLKRAAAKEDSRAPELVIANWYRASGNQEEFDKWMGIARAQHPNVPGTQMVVAQWAMGNEDFEAAKAAVNQAESASEKELPAAVLIKAQIAFANRDYAGAEQLYEKLFQSNPNNLQVSNMYAMCMIENSDEEKKKAAEQLLTRNLRALPNDAATTIAFAWVLYRRGERVNSQRVFERVAQEVQSSRPAPETAYFLATYISDRGDTANAIKLLNFASESKGLFLYRQAAGELLAKLEAKVAAAAQQETLPEPAGN